MLSLIVKIFTLARRQRAGRLIDYVWSTGRFGVCFGPRWVLFGKRTER
jgi:hypothetical protein